MSEQDYCIRWPCTGPFPVFDHSKEFIHAKLNMSKVPVFRMIFYISENAHKRIGGDRLWRATSGVIYSADEE